MNNIHDIIVSPIITEKSSIQKDENNTVSFKVAMSANKIQIKDAVEKLFNVKVLGVRSTNYRGKNKRVGKNFGRTSDFKKAYVTLEKGAKVSFFEGV